MATNLNPVTGSDGHQAGTPSASTSSSSNLTDKDAFLKLLVAQIKYQDPLNPADGVQFLSQLAQFSQLEQLININGQLTTLVSDGQPTAAPAATTSQTAHV
jgi:flagellar basal-body rod modification protein FlgD